MKNMLKCAYCDWKTSRFVGAKHRGERKLRRHVLDEHSKEYCTSQGLQDVADDTPWIRDTDDTGEQAL